MILHYLQMTYNNSSSVNEEVLTEKKWVKIYRKTENNKEPENSFYFYSKGNPNNSIIDWDDIDDMMNRIFISKNGTYKQSLNPDAVKNLETEFKNIITKKITKRNRPYTAVVANIPITASTPNVLSLRDRDMRRDAENIANDHEKLKNKNNGKVLVHHINGFEFDNDPMNMVVVDYNSEDDAEKPLALAHAVHAILHNIQKKYKGDIKTVLNNENSCSTEIRYIDPLSNNVVTKKATLIIN